MKSVSISMQGGVRRAIPIRIEHLITQDEMVTILAYSERYHLPGEPLPIHSRASAMQMVRGILADHGEADLWVWSDNMPERTVEEVHRWATETVERLFDAIYAA
jgi:hypothetical protein